MAPTKKKVSNYIPDYIAFDILSKLPVKSLKRFSCVHKSWANLFENPQFMSTYRNNFLSKDDDHNSRLLLKQSMPPRAFDDDDNLFLLSGETFENNVKLDWPPPFEHHRHIFIMGSAVNGILCLYQGHGHGTVFCIGQKAVLWNPCTDEFRVIPTGSFDCPLYKVVHPGSDYPPLPVNTSLRLHGFGYDPATDDSKLIRNFCFFDDDAKGGPNDETLWQIYSLRSNCWRKLHVEMPNQWWNWRSREIGYAVYLNGVCHWWGYEDYNGEALLVSFNLSDEVFITTPLSDGGYDRHLVVLKGSIAMIEYGSTLGFDISILGELGVMESWTKLFSIGPLPCIHKPMFGYGYGPVPYFHEPIGVGKKGDIFFLKYGDEELVRFDLNTEMIEEIGVQGKSNCCQIVIYNESRLPIGGINS